MMAGFLLFAFVLIICWGAVFVFCCSFICFCFLLLLLLVVVVLFVCLFVYLFVHTLGGWGLGFFLSGGWEGGE